MLSSVAIPSDERRMQVHQQVALPLQPGNKPARYFRVQQLVVYCNGTVLYCTVVVVVVDAEPMAPEPKERTLRQHAQIYTTPCTPHD